MRLDIRSLAAGAAGLALCPPGAGMAGAQRHHRRAVHGRRHHRPVRAADRHAHAAEARQGLHRRKQGGRRRQYRRHAVARAPNDGYTFLLGTVSTHAINPFLYSKMPFDRLKDFQPVSLVARLPNMLVVNPKIPAKTPAELITYLKANPDKLSYASSGAGTSIHLAAELFKMMTGTKMTHIPYRSRAR